MMVRGRFRPFTLLHNDMLQGAAGQFFCEPEGSVDLDSNVGRSCLLPIDLAADSLRACKCACAPPAAHVARQRQ